MSDFKQDYNKNFVDNLAMQAVYPTTSSTMRLGAYGTFKKGVFNVLGYLDTTYGITWPTPQPMSISGPLSFTSKGVSSQIYQMEGTATVPVPVLPNNPEVNGQITYSFSRENSSVVTCSNVTSEVISDDLKYFFQETVWNVLKNYPDKNKPKGFSTWDYRIVYQIFRSPNYVLVGTSSKNTSFSMSGSAPMITEYVNGNVRAGMELGSSQSMELQLYSNDDESPKAVGMLMMAFSSTHPGKVYMPRIEK